MYAIGWTMIVCGCVGAIRFMMHGSQHVDRPTAGLFVGGVGCLWIGSELK
jgi:hypothetical protein